MANQLASDHSWLVGVGTSLRRIHVLICWFLAPYGGGDFLHTSTGFLMKMQCSTIQMAPQKHNIVNISKENNAFLKP